MREVKEIRVAFVGVSHWHVPLYLRAADQMNIIAMSDPNEDKVKMMAEQYGCAYYTDTDKLLDEMRPEFVFAFAPHDEMPHLAMKLIDRKISFSIEKPLGLSTADVEKVRKEADAAGIFVSIPFVWRYSALLQDFRSAVKPDDILHLAFKFIAGPPSRYVKTSPWMLETKRAGGGCMTNLGVHFIDMALYLTASDSGEVLASSYHYASLYDIETYATSLVKLSGGASLILETGYSFPMDSEQRDNRWNIVTKNGYYTLGDGAFERRIYGRKTEKMRMSTDSDDYYPIYTLETLRQYMAGETPTAGLRELIPVRKILDRMNSMSE